MLNENEGQEAWDYGLKPRERLFILHYCTDPEAFLNATESYRRTFRKKDRATGKIIEPTTESCQTSGARLIAKSHIKMAIAMLLKLTQNDLDDNAVYQLLHDVYLFATYNPSDIVDKNGVLKCRKLEDLGELAKCVVDIIPGKYGMHIKLADRSKYITQYLQYLDIIRDAPVQETKLNVIEMVQKSISVEDWNRLAEEQDG
ncbi:MAG: hypothetical protein J6S85_12710 [Methanobrevibacter sp.]|nr:hypothetical protein [Methanobrevibacter sp.]